MTIQMERDKLIRSIASARTALNTVALMLQGVVAIVESEPLELEDDLWQVIERLESAAKDAVQASYSVDTALGLLNKIK